MTTETMTADAVHRQMQDAAEASSPEVREHLSLPCGKGVRQGDVYLVRVQSAHHGEKLATKQLVQGTSQGSRHIAEGRVTLYAENGDRPQGVAETSLLGPVVVADGPWTLTHPEHAHYRLPAGTYVTIHQMDPRTMQRVQD